MTLEMIEKNGERRYELVFTEAELMYQLNPVVLAKVGAHMGVDRISSKLMALSFLAKELEDQTMALKTM